MNILNRLKRKATLFSLALLCTLGGALALHATAPTVETVIPAVAEETTESTPVETWDISATANDSVTAKLYEDTENEGYYTLSIEGTGYMTNFSRTLYAPWTKTYRTCIREVVIENEVKNIGGGAFSDCNNLLRVSIPKNLTRIEKKAFYGCSRLMNVEIPESVISIE